MEHASLDVTFGTKAETASYKIETIQTKLSPFKIGKKFTGKQKEISTLISDGINTAKANEYGISVMKLHGMNCRDVEQILEYSWIEG